MRRMVSIYLILALVGISVPTFFRTIHRRMVGVNSEVYLQGRNMEYYFEKEVRTIVEQMGRELQKPPVNATIDKKTGEIIPESYGVYVDVDQTVVNVMQAPGNSRLEVVTIPIKPLFRAEHIKVLVDNLGDFSTPLMGSSDRVTNIRLSLAAINYHILMPGEVFSFNGVVGERTWEKGYRPAPIFIGEGVAPGVGGGICQTSSTLYNAVLRANLEIVERSIHSRPPSYIQHGKDATVAWPYTDFKFRNNTSTPIIVRGEIQGWRARVWIMGVANK